MTNKFAKEIKSEGNVLALRWLKGDRKEKWRMEQEFANLLRDEAHHRITKGEKFIELNAYKETFDYIPNYMVESIWEVELPSHTYAPANPYETRDLEKARLALSGEKDLDPPDDMQIADEIDFIISGDHERTLDVLVEQMRLKND